MLFPILTIVVVGIVSAFTSNYHPRWNFNWNTIRPEIKDSIAPYEFKYLTNGVGAMGSSTQNEVDRRRWIMSNATESELLKLTTYPNGTIKAIAYEGLLRKEEFRAKTELTVKAIQDTTYKVFFLSGCEAWEREIGAYLMQDVLILDDQIPPLRSKYLANIDLSDSDKNLILSEYIKFTTNF